MNNEAKHTTAPVTTAPVKSTSLATSPLPAAPIKSTAPAASPLPAAPVKCSFFGTPVLFLLLITTILFLEGCKTKQTITEKATVKTDSTAHWDLNDSLFKKVTLLATLQSDLQRFRDENTRLLNEASTHFISYDTAAPVNPQTGKPPIASESYTVSKSTLEQSKKEYETQLQTATIEKETLTRQNRNLQLTVEKLTNENKQLTEKTTTPGLNLKPLLAGLILGMILSFLIYLNIK
jgi:hypothetical protein